MRPDRPTASERPCVVFLHVPKTAGQTLNAILAREFDPASTAIVSDPSDPWTPFARVSARRRVTLVRGHMPYGAHEALGIDAVYITMLRDPVARVLSTYDYVKRTPRHPLHGIVRGSEMTLSQFIESDIDRQEVVNGQVRLLSGVIDEDPDERSLSKAIDNLKTFALVGLTERFDESVLLLRHRLGWKLPLYVSKNVAPRLLPDKLPGATDIELIKRLNELDTELYDTARRLLDQNIAASGVGFRAELVAFRQLNWLASRYATITKRRRRG